VLWQKRLHPAARVLAFEPDPDAFAMLERNVSANGLEDVTLVRKAVGASDGRATFQVDPDRPGSLVGSIEDRGLPVGAEVEVTRLSSYLEGPVDFLKLDVEGAEGAVLHELAAAGKLGLVDQMVIEYHHHLHPQSDALGGVLALLEAHGFGYQIAAQQRLPTTRRRSQDVLVYAYKKEREPGL
jgi:FkbM family methyltransferase